MVMIINELSQVRHMMIMVLAMGEVPGRRNISAVT